MIGLEVLWLLLPVAAGTGWWVARNTYVERGTTKAKQSSGLRLNYFKGINYLLNEQPDKAIEVFIKLLEVDSETLDTHFALGNLYRRRGDVERAIRVHQNLMSHDSLSDEQRTEALLELSQDYLSAGLLDRAENLFSELVERKSHQVQALRQLIDIYEQEKDWAKAIQSAHQLEKATGNQLGQIIAHYYCEQANQYRSKGDPDRALKQTRRARITHAACVRANLLDADIYAELGEHERAIHALQRVEEQDPDFLPEIVDRLHRSFRALERTDALNNYLSRLMNRYGWTSVILTMANIKLDSDGPPAAIRFITEQLRQRASVRSLKRLIELESMNRHRTDETNNYIEILKRLTTELLHEQPIYKCQHCGFPVRSLHWQCPRCKHWATIKPIKGVEGE